jgi:hypothetical protein
MPVRTACSIKDLSAAVAELREQCAERAPRVVLFFASPRYDPRELSRQMRESFPEACVAGCSSAGEMAGGHMLSGSVVAMFLDDDVVEDAAVAVLPNLSAGIRLPEALAEFERHFGAPLSSLDLEKFAGLVMVDGLSGAEERLMEKLGDATDLFFVGGSAGDDLRFQGAQVLAEGGCASDAAVLLLLRLRRGFDIVKTQSFRPSGQRLLATRVDESRRMVMEFNYLPALDAYAQALGVTPAEAPAYFFKHPLGLMAAGNPFVRSPQRAEGSAIFFYCRIQGGVELEVLEASDIVADTRAAIEACKADGAIQGLIDFQCILRTVQLRNEQRCDEYGGIFAGVPTVGFSTYGEAFLGHMNQTSTMLLFR